MSGTEFLWSSVIPGLREIEDVAISNTILVLAIALLIVLVGTARTSMKCDEDAIPDDRLTLRNVAELMMEAILAVLDIGLGEKGRKFVWLIGTCLIFILFSNLAGLIPGLFPPTSSLNTTAACAVSIFVFYNYLGFKEHGIGYLKHFLGPVWWLTPLMIPLEIISHISRPLSLSMRLFGNLFGDHTVTLTFIALTPMWFPIVPLPVMILGLFVAILQAFVFSLLSMSYITGATEHSSH